MIHLTIQTKNYMKIAKLNEFNVETSQSILNALNKIILKEKVGRILNLWFFLYVQRII